MGCLSLKSSCPSHKDICNLAHSCHLILGSQTIWVATLSQFFESFVEWHLWLEMIQSLLTQFKVLEVDMFTAPVSPPFLLLPRHLYIPAEGPDAFMVDWKQWVSICLFPSPGSIISCTCACLCSFCCKILLIASKWKSQPWCKQLHQ